MEKGIKNKLLIARLDHLEENKRYFENALETVLSSASFYENTVCCVFVVIIYYNQYSPTKALPRFFK